MSIDFSEDLSRSEVSLQLFAKIISALQNQNPPIDDDSIIDWEGVSPLVDLHNVDIDVGAADIEKTEYLATVTPMMYGRRIPANPLAYDLTHTTHGNLSFPNPMDEALKYAGGCKTDGTGYIVIDDHDLFDFANAMGIPIWLKLPATAGGDGIQTIIDKEDFALEIDAHATAANRLRGRVTIGGMDYEVTYTYTPNAWFAVILYHDGTNLTIYVNDTQQDQIAAAGSIDTNATNLGILAKADGSQKCKANTMIAWLGIYDMTINSTWRTNWFTNGILDLSGDGLYEITTIPFVSDENPRPNFMPGLATFS